MSASSIDVHPELVGQVEEGRVVRVVRGPDGVEPELLHEHEVGAHRLHRDDPAGVLVEVVAVDPADEDPGAVDQQVETRDLDPPEADLDRHLLGDRRRPGRAGRHAAGSAFGCSADQRRDVGDLEVPGDEAVERRRHPGGGRAARRSHRPADSGRPAARRNMSRWSSSVQPSSVVRSTATRLGAERLRRRRRATPRRVQPGGSARPGKPTVTVRSSVPVVRSSARPASTRTSARWTGRVAYRKTGRRDPAVPPLVLVLDVGRVRPLHDAQGQGVRPGPEALGEVELRGEVRVLADADLVAVEARRSGRSRRPRRGGRPAGRPTPRGSSNSRS